MAVFAKKPSGKKSAALIDNKNAAGKHAWMNVGKPHKGISGMAGRAMGLKQFASEKDKMMHEAAMKSLGTSKPLPNAKAIIAMTSKRKVPW